MSPQSQWLRPRCAKTWYALTLRSVPQIIELSRRTTRTKQQNLVWAVVYNIIGMPDAAGVFFPANAIVLRPILASAVMAFSSADVVLNSLRLRQVRFA